MKYLNARNTAFGEDRRSYKTGNGVTSNQTVLTSTTTMAGLKPILMG